MIDHPLPPRSVCSRSADGEAAVVTVGKVQLAGCPALAATGSGWLPLAESEHGGGGEGEVVGGTAVEVGWAVRTADQRYRQEVGIRRPAVADGLAGELRWDVAGWVQPKQ